jgi:hypothetical protein
MRSGSRQMSTRRNARGSLPLHQPSYSTLNFKTRSFSESPTSVHSGLHMDRATMPFTCTSALMSNWNAGTCRISRRKTSQPIRAADRRGVSKPGAALPRQDRVTRSLRSLLWRLCRLWRALPCGSAGPWPQRPALNNLKRELTTCFTDSTAAGRLL